MTTLYETFDDLHEFRAKHGFANIIPLKHVATSLFLSQATIKSKIRQGEDASGLRGLKIENDFFVFADSVENKLNEERVLHRKTLALLLEHLDEGKTALNYSDGMDFIGLRHQISSDRTRYAKILGRVPTATHEICECLVTVIVHSKGKGVPSGGFFGLAEWLNEEEEEEIYDLSDSDALTRSETEAVLENLKEIKEKLPGKMKELFDL